MELSLAPGVVFTIGSIEITDTVVISLCISVVLVLLSIIFTRNLSLVPTTKRQVVLETIVVGLDNMVKSSMGERNKKYTPYIGTLFIFLTICNISGLFAVKPPTSDVHMTATLAIMTFILIIYNGIIHKGLIGYLKGFTEPIIFLLPITIIGELAVPFSMALRLFGNIIGGYLIMTLVYSALASITTSIGFSIPIFEIGIPIFLHGYFDVFSGLIQSFIFTMLTMVFVSMAQE